MRDRAQAPAHHAGDLRAGHDRDVARVAHRAKAERGGTRRRRARTRRHRRTPPAATPSTTAIRERRDSSYWRTMSRPVLAVDFQWIWRRESPGRVLADGVERHVGVDESAGGAALEVADQAGARRRQRGRAGVDVQLVDVLEGVLAPEQAERVAAHRRGRADRHDPAAEGGDVERLRDGVVGAQQRHAELDEALAHGDVDAAGQRDAPAVVAHHDLAGDAVARDDALVRERQVDVVGPRAEEERHARDQQEQRDRPGDHPLDPAEHDPERRAPPSPRGRPARPPAAPCARSTPRPRRWPRPSRATTRAHHTTALTSGRPRARGGHRASR